MVIVDYKEFYKPIHIFDKRTFKHVVSFGVIGQGPNEITRIGDVCYNKKEREIYVLDAGRLIINAFSIDSVISNPEFPFYEKIKFERGAGPAEYYMQNDSIAYARCMMPIGVNDFELSTIVWNMYTGEKKILEYKHPRIHKKRYFLAVSFPDSVYVESSFTYDLISMFNLEGKLIKNIYGPQWGTTHLQCFSYALFTKDYLVSCYNGDVYEQNLPTHKCIVFTKQGDYVATLELEYKIISMCYDQESDRLIFTFDDDIQFGYLDLKDLKLK